MGVCGIPLLINNISAAEATGATSAKLAQATTEFRVAQNFFSDILNAQLVIFSVIVGVLLGASWLYSQKISKQIVEKGVRIAVNRIEREMSKKFEEKQKNLAEGIAKELIEQKKEVASLRAEVYRTLGQFWDSESSYATAFIWWIRAAYYFANVREENLTRIALSSAKESVEKIEYGTELNLDIIGEFQRMIALIDDKLYKVEKDLLDQAFKEALGRKVPKH